MPRTPRSPSFLLALLLLASCYTAEAVQKLPTDFWINLEGLLYAVWLDIASVGALLL